MVVTEGRKLSVFKKAKIKHTTKSTYSARVETLIVFLGAGASNVFRIPTMPGFIKIFDREIGEYRELYQGIKNRFSEDEFDLEVLMTILEDLTKEGNEMFKTVSPQTTDFLFRMPRKEALRFIHNKEAKVLAKELLAKLKQVIRRECRKAVEDNKEVDNILSKYDHLFKILSKAPTEVDLTADDGETKYPSNLKIITTNWDNCVETYFNRRQIEFSNGITLKRGENVFDINSFQDKKAVVGIFKLHGSVDLFSKADKIRKLSAFPEGRTTFGEEFGEEVMRWPIEFGGYRMIIQSPYLDLFRLFRQRIEDDMAWVLIGSSFRDISICTTMNDVVRLRIRRRYPKIVFINPSAKAVVKRLRAWDMITLADLMEKNMIEEHWGSDECNTKLPSALK